MVLGHCNLAWGVSPLDALHSDFDRLVVLGDDVKALEQNRILLSDCRKQPVKITVRGTSGSLASGYAIVSSVRMAR